MYWIYQLCELSGAKVWRKKGGVRHYGVILGYIRGVLYVLHNSPSCGGVCVTTMEDFAAGETVYVAARPVPGTEEAVVGRALAIALTDQRYNLAFFNCEHYANAATEGRAYSSQVMTVLGVLGIALSGYAGFRIMRALNQR